MGGGNEFISPFGIVRHSRDQGHGHGGIDIPLKANAPIYAVADGTILPAETSSDGARGSDVKLLISGSAGEGWGFLYEHVSLEPGITVGDAVTRGQMIARNGLASDRRNNHLALSYWFNEYTFYRDHRCWADHLDPSPRKLLLDYFNSPQTVARVTAQWDGASEEGSYALKALLDGERFPGGPQLCYPLGLDVRVTATVAPTPTPTATPSPTPSATPRPASTLDFEGFTHMPVDFDAVLNATSTCTDLPRVTPFFNHSNTNHAEGPRKWYLTSCPGDVVKVYLPAKGVLHEWAIRAPGGEEGVEEVLNGEPVLVNVQVRFEVSPTIEVFYMHLTLLAEIEARVQDSPNGYVIFEAGTHIGYIYRPPPDSFYTLDFGVHDRSTHAGITRDPDEGWNTMVNPLDYFVHDLRESILEAYRPTYETLVAMGTFPYSDIEDSRQNLNEQDTIWGLWFKDDVVDVWDGFAWSVISLVKTADLHQATYWRTLQEFPEMDGLFVEEAREEAVGKPLYEGQPIGLSKFYMVSGTDAAGVARIAEDWGDRPRTIYLKYEVRPNTAGRFDDKLIVEGFQTFEAAAASNFSDNAVAFGREPCIRSTCS